MPNMITKVKTEKQGVRKNISAGNGPPGWKSVLSDIKHDIGELERFAAIVERKIERGEPWPCEVLATQN